MGVSKLLSYCDNCEFTKENVNLITVAKDRDGIEILVDFASFQFKFNAQFWSMMAEQSNNNYLRVIGGEYDSLRTYLKDIIEGLSKVNIKLIFYVEGDRDNSTKDHVYKSRSQGHADLVEDTIKLCKNDKSMEEIREFPRPDLQKIQLIEILTKCKCEIVTVVTGEADIIIAKALHEREKAYAVFSVDADFCVFENCSLITKGLFDEHKDENFGEIKTDVIRTKKVMTALEVRTNIVNDFSLRLIASLLKKI